MHFIYDKDLGKLKCWQIPSQPLYEPKKQNILLSCFKWWSNKGGIVVRNHISLFEWTFDTYMYTLEVWLEPL